VRISCVIPTRERREMVCQAVESVLSQTVACDEIVVVDDGSRDGTEAEVERRFPGVKVVTLPGRGPGAARNAGVKEASGDLLMFLDSDDRWLPDHVERLAAVVGRGFQVAYGTTLTKDAVNGGSFLIPEAQEGLEGECFGALLNWCFLVPSSLAVTREAFDRVGGFPEEGFAEDWEFLLALSRRHPFGFAGIEPITLRRLHGESLCCLRQGMDGVRQAFSRIRQRFAHDPECSERVANRFHALQRFIDKEQRGWSTVQEWYLDMKKRGMV